MIFSGRVLTRHCQTCDISLARTYPTSLLFLMFLAAAGAALVLPPLMAQWGNHWWVFAGALVGNLVLALAVLSVIDAAMKLRGALPHDCPKCGGEMTKGGGFYDFVWVPTASEIVSAPVYFGVVLLGKWVMKLMGS